MKRSKVCGTDKTHLKSDAIAGSFLKGSRQFDLYSFGLDKQPRQEKTFNLNTKRKKYKLLSVR